MTIIFDDDEIEWVRFPAPPGFVPLTIRQQLARDFDEEASFYVCDGQMLLLPVVLAYS